VHGDVALVHVFPPVDEVTVYPVMAEPPVEDGAVHETVAAEPPTAVPMVGAPGTVAAVTLDEGVDVELLPAALEATTVNVYGVPAVRPELMTHEVLVVEHVPVPGDEVTT
jgi:hypothetical protein